MSHLRFEYERGENMNPNAACNTRIMIGLLLASFAVAVSCSEKAPSSGDPPSSGGGGAGDGGSGGSANNPDGGEISQAIRATRLRAEYRVNPLGIDVTKPRLDWLLESDVQAQKQTAYQIVVASTQEALLGDQGDLWDTGKIPSDRSTQIAYDGKALGSRTRAWWKVRVWDKDDAPSAWSEPAWWETGLLQQSDWQAKWIASPSAMGLGLDGARWIWFPEGVPGTSAPAGERFFRKVFTIPAGTAVVKAICDMTADNEFELFVNGTVVGSETDWKEVRHFSFGSLLSSGANVIAIRTRNVDGPAGLIAALDVALDNGSKVQLKTDSSWKSSNLTASQLEGFQERDYNDSAWSVSSDIAPFGSGPWGTPVAGTVPSHLRKQFSVAAEVKRARIYATALGIYELWLNGQRVGLDHLTPGWTDYRKRLQVQTYDVTSLIANGDNALGAIVADGWFNGKIGFLGRSDFFGGGPDQLLLQLELDYADGTRQVIASDGQGAQAWKSGAGPILAADLMNGETYDARDELTGWSEPGFDEAGWDTAQVIPDTSGRRLVADATPGVQVSQEIASISVKEIQPGVFIYDLGQNMVGWARLRVKGTRGSALRLRFSEVLNPDGTLYTTSLRGARATDTYVLRGGDEEAYEPHFTTHGFRYVELSGDTGALSTTPDLSAITGIVAHSAMTPTGVFETSSPMVNQLQSNIVWGQKGNFVSVPTDCPQRDERLGWMGDAQIFVRTSTFNMDVSGFFTKWVRDVKEAQGTNGAFTDVSPNPSLAMGTPAWGDAGVIVPWTIYLAYGDIRILEEQYTSMAGWIDYIRSANPNFLWQNQRGSDFGDWLSINADTDKELIATAFYAHSTDIVARAARALGRDSDTAQYTALFESIKSAFNSAYVQNDGKIRSDTQTSYALALRFNLLPDALRPLAVQHLADNVTARGHLSSGFIGVAHLLPALSSGGRSDIAYQLLNTETFPSWFYEIKKGATTIWERWDGITENGEFQDPGMNSFNHYSFGAVGEWMYSTIAGIGLDEANPGYKHFFIRPEPGGGLDAARGSLDTIHGTIVSDWKAANDVFTLKLTVPVNTTASVRLPYNKEVLESGAPVTAGPDGDYLVQSGHYEFTASMR